MVAGASSSVAVEGAAQVVMMAQPGPLSTVDRVGKDEFEASLNPVPSPSQGLPPSPDTFRSVDEGGWMDDLGRYESMDDQDVSVPSAEEIYASSLEAPAPAPTPVSEAPAPNPVSEATLDPSTLSKPKSVFVDLPPE
jgi:hypothetical protein